MKSKNKKTSKTNKQELEQDIKPNDCYCEKCDCVGNYCNCEPEGVPVPTPEPTSTPERRMYNRRAIQAEIDIDKKIRALLEKNAYNLNQIAGMLMVPLERVKKVNHERRKTNT